MSEGTRNLGQVSGIYIGATPPENIAVIWFDNTPAIMQHKVYDISLQQWKTLALNIVSSITYSELVNLASTVGLSIAKYYRITDIGDCLALAITTTKVQYADSIGNILVDDLGSNIQYHITSSNLLIDDIAGVFDTINRKLIFDFVADDINFQEDYVLGKRKRNNVWSLAKFKFSKFLSSTLGNSISWQNGLYFNFGSAINAIKDVPGGIVSKSAFDQIIALQNIAINNVAEQNQGIIDAAAAAISAATSAQEIYGKQIPSTPLVGEPTDVAAQDSLFTIVQKFQRWITKMKIASGIKLTNNFAPVNSAQNITNQDTVDSAFRKVQYWITNMYANMKLTDDWAPYDYTEEISDLAPGDTINEAFKKIQGKLNQIGDLYNGRILSKEKLSTIATQSVTVLDFRIGTLNMFDANTLETNVQNVRQVRMSALAGGFRAKEGTKISEMDINGLYVYAGGKNLYPIDETRIHKVGIAVIGVADVERDVSDRNFIAGVAGRAINLNSNPAPAFGGYFERLKAVGLNLETKVISSNYDAVPTDLFIACHVGAGNTVNVTLPPAPYKGQVFMVKNVFGSLLNLISPTPGMMYQGVIETLYTLSVADINKTAIFIFDGLKWQMNIIN